MQKQVGEVSDSVVKREGRGWENAPQTELLNEMSKNNNDKKNYNNKNIRFTDFPPPLHPLQALLYLPS